jgi:phosphonate transport system substrate-binding protein
MKLVNVHYPPSRYISILLIVFVWILSSCAPTTPTLTPTPTASTTPIALESITPTLESTLRPTSTPTLPPLGDEGNPIKIGFMLTPEEIQQQEAAEDIIFMISEITGYAVEGFFYPDFQSISSAILDGDLDLFWLGPFEYLYLNWEGAAEVILATNHLGVYAYGVQFMAHVDRGFTVYYNPETDQSEGNMMDALQQFSGTRPCLINPHSIPGYYVPMGLLASVSTPTLDPVFTYDYSAVVRALYIQGICDFGVGYALIGDPRTASDIQQDLSDVEEQVIVVWQSEGIIPNLNLAASTSLPLNIQYRLKEAFLDLSKTQEGLTLISTALDYEVEALKEITDQFYNPLRDAIVPLEPDLEAILFSQSNP